MVMKLNKMVFDEKKIEKAARQISEKVVDAIGFDDSKPTHLAFLDGHVDGFNAGAKWAINEFMKDLWHPANKEPKKNRLVLTDTRSIMDKDYICWTTVKLTENGFIRNWSNYAKVTKITRWLYLDDLFSKEGGKHD